MRMPFLRVNISLDKTDDTKLSKPSELSSVDKISISRSRFKTATPIHIQQIGNSFRTQSFNFIFSGSIKVFREFHLFKAF